MASPPNEMGLGKTIQHTWAVIKGFWETPLDCSANKRHVQLGNGVQKVVSCFQNLNILWFSEGAQAEKTGCQASRLSHVHCHGAKWQWILVQQPYINPSRLIPWQTSCIRLSSSSVLATS